MKNIIRIIVLVIIMLLCCVDVHAESPSNWQIAKSICRKQYNIKKVKLVYGCYSKKASNIILHRKNKNYVVIEKFVSYSRGRYGFDKHGHYIKYNKYVKKGKRVVSYCIYSPYNNYCDGVDFVVDNKMVR